MDDLIFCVDVVETVSGQSRCSLFESFDHDIAWKIANNYNKQNKNPYVYADVYNVEIGEE